MGANNILQMFKTCMWTPMYAVCCMHLIHLYSNRFSFSLFFSNFYNTDAINYIIVQYDFWSKIGFLWSLESNVCAWPFLMKITFKPNHLLNVLTCTCILVQLPLAILKVKVLDNIS